MNEKHDKVKQEKELQRAMALSVACPYCESEGLSDEKLKNQLFFLIYGQAFFAQPSDVAPDGLLNDFETRPKPTLIIENGENGIEFRQTEFTKRYLS